MRNTQYLMILEIPFNFSATAPVAFPLIPVSISSNINTGILSVSANTFL